MKRTMCTGIGLALALAACGDNADDREHELEQVIAELQQQLDELHAEIEAGSAALAARTAERDAARSERDDIANRVGPAVTLEVPLVYGDAPLALGTSYPLPGGGAIAFREVRYWLSNVALQRADDTWVALPDTYYLVEARGEQPLTNGTSAAITLPAKRRESIALPAIPAGSYRGVRFDIGVDAARNDDLSNTAGELGSLKNMTFDNGWMWFTSYKFTRTVADTDATNDVAEVSWDNGSNADLRTVTVAFPAAVDLANAQRYAIRLRADLAQVVTDVSPTAHPVIDAETPEVRTQLADAFRDMFALVAVEPAP